RANALAALSDFACGERGLRRAEHIFSGSGGLTLSYFAGGVRFSLRASGPNRPHQPEASAQKRRKSFPRLHFRLVSKIRDGRRLGLEKMELLELYHSLTGEP